MAHRTRQTFIIEIKDSGPGIAELDEILAGRYRSKSGLGIGVIGTKRLMDRVDIASSARGTTITLAKILPPSAVTSSAKDLQAMVDELSQRAPAGPMEEIQVQNQELLSAIEESRARQEELAQVNQELAETNTGVLALYDELETLNRISMMLASKLDLRPLIQSIVDVTTTLTDAEIGAYFSLEDDGRWLLYATSGTKADVLADFPEHSAADFFGADFANVGMLHIPDLESEGQPSCAAKFAAAISGAIKIRACLTIPVLEATEQLIGAFVFASSKPNVFTERSERILSSVATQAAVGIEKARLFQTVTAASNAKDQFFATLSHELRTPLNPALAIVSSLQGNPRVPPELREDISIVARNIRLEARLIDDLLDFNRLIKGKVELMKEPADAHALIESVVEICREDSEIKRHQLSIKLEATRSVVSADPARLQQVLWNVLKNAIKFTPAGGSISIHTFNLTGKFCLEITDSGCGIGPGSVERIFNAFDQGQKKTPAHFGGLGLGLSIARMFVDLHHGRIFAASPGLGQGSTITIELPLSDAPLQTNIAQASPISLTLLQGHILLVDDHPDTLSSLTRLLERKGFHVTPAADGATAVTLAGEITFDLLISDLGLPDCSGLELVGKIAAIRKVPAIALSGYGMESDLAESKNAGFQIHITKPVDFEQLLAAIRNLMTQNGC